MAAAGSSVGNVEHDLLSGEGSRHDPVPCAWQPDSADPLQGGQPVWRDPSTRLSSDIRVWVVVTDPCSGEGSEHPQLLQPALERGGPHGVAVIGVENQRLRPTFADPLPEAGAADEIKGDLGVLPLSHLPGHKLADAKVDQQIEVQPDTKDAGGQVGDVPAPELFGPLASSRGTRRGSWGGRARPRKWGWPWAWSSR